MGAKCYKIGIFFCLWIVIALFLEIFNVPQYRFSHLVEKLGALLAFVVTWGLTEWIYFKIQLRKSERKQMKIQEKGYNLEKVRIRFFISYLFYILYEFLWTPLEISRLYNTWGYLPSKIHYSFVFPKLIILAVILTLIYSGIRYRQLSQTTKEQ